MHSRYTIISSFKSITSISPVLDFCLDGGFFIGLERSYPFDYAQGERTNKKTFVVKKYVHPERNVTKSNGYERKFMQKYKLVIAYDGTDFHGWQIQPKSITVASTLQYSFKHTFQKEISLLGASRTDAGVHALGQIAQFHTDLHLPAKVIKNSWNNALPSNIVIRSLEPIISDFHPHKNILNKTYYYHLFIKRPLPFIARYGWHWQFIHQVDFVKLEKILLYFIGTHNFRSFCKNEERQSTIRTIENINISFIKSWQAYRITIIGPGFLHYQIRRMIGASLDIARRQEFAPEHIKELLENPCDKQAYTRAAAQGLCLRKIKYNKRSNPFDYASGVVKTMPNRQGERNLKNIL